jgi:hypothetical protein
MRQAEHHQRRNLEARPATLGVRYSLWCWCCTPMLLEAKNAMRQYRGLYYFTAADFAAQTLDFAWTTCVC